LVRVGVDFAVVAGVERMGVDVDSVDDGVSVCGRAEGASWPGADGLAWPAGCGCAVTCGESGAGEAGAV
jgi:hypothetical protein